MCGTGYKSGTHLEAQSWGFMSHRTAANKFIETTNLC